MKKLALSMAVCFLSLSFLMTGCAVNFYKQSPRSKQELNKLKTKVDELENLRLAEKERFEQVKMMLEGKLKEQISDNQVSLRVSDAGLAIVLSDNILFDSGKADIKTQAYSVLDNVAAILKSEVPQKKIGIGGHTDDVPITYSNWKSNWELSAARATNVLYYLEKQDISPNRLSSIGG